VSLTVNRLREADEGCLFSPKLVRDAVTAGGRFPIPLILVSEQGSKLRREDSTIGWLDSIERTVHPTRRAGSARHSRLPAAGAERRRLDPYKAALGSPARLSPT
jgi:hypothetical protein